MIKNIWFCGFALLYLGFTNRKAMSNKEKVLAYLEEWADKGINLQNGCAIQKCPNHYLTGYFGIYIDGKRVASISKKEYGETFEAVSRILQLDPPQAAPIKWTSNGDYYYSDCAEYSVKPSPYSKGFLGYFKNEYILGSEQPEEEQSFASCQAHKQKRFNKLRGYNEQ